jgi:hypothetical protein
MALYTHYLIRNLFSILSLFREVIELDINFQKSLVVPITLTLMVCLGEFPVLRTSFPMKYLGLPLSV